MLQYTYDLKIKDIYTKAEINILNLNVYLL